MAAGFVLRVENGEQAGQQFPLAAPSVVIGRHSEADIVLEGSQISRRHARLEVIDDRAILTDLNSANGTFVNGSRLATPQPLSPGDLIELGGYRLRVELPAAAAVPATVVATAQDHTATQFIGAAAPEPASIAAGAILNGRYRLERSIGQGGFARVFLANDLALKRPIAVKVMNVELVGEGGIEDFLTRFANEAQAIANLDHPHILAIHDFGQFGATGFLVMPYVAGGTLGDALRLHGRFAPHRASRYLRQVAAALDYAHRRNLVHRDIKPQNMLLRSEDDHLLLADFGIAKVLTATSAQSRTGVAGTIAYMAPEQFQGNVSRATDIYALGCVLFQWLTGKLPFGGSTEQVIFGHITAPVPLLAESGADLPPTAQTVIARALAKNPADRFASAGDMAAAFDAALGKSAPTRLPDTPPPPPPPGLVPLPIVPPPPIAPSPQPPRGTAALPPPRPVTPIQVPQPQNDFMPSPPPATSLTGPAVVSALLALGAAIVIAYKQIVNEEGFDLARISVAAVFAAIWLIRAAALQRTSPARAGAGQGLIRALPLLLPSCATAALITIVSPRGDFNLTIPAWCVALALAAIGPLIVPNASKARSVGAALASASALALGALGLALLTLVRLFIFFRTDDYDAALAPALVVCLAGVIGAIVVLQVARRFFPSIGRWLWLPALLLALAGTFLL